MAEDDTRPTHHSVPASALAAVKDNGGLPGKLSMVESEGKNVDGSPDGNKRVRITQEGYGEWPDCTVCGDQVEPTGYNLHQREHDAAAKAAMAKK